MCDVMIAITGAVRALTNWHMRYGAPEIRHQ